MSLLITDKDVANIAAATSKVIQDAIGETANVLVTPMTTAIGNAIESAGASIAAQLAPAVAELNVGIAGVPAIVGKAVGKVLDELDGLTISGTVVFSAVVSRRKP